MAAFLQIVSGIYLAIVWLVVFQVVTNPVLASTTTDPSLAKGLAILSGIFLTIPAAMMFAFATLVADTRRIREHLAAIRRYYEPGRL